MYDLERDPSHEQKLCQFPPSFFSLRLVNIISLNWVTLCIPTTFRVTTYLSCHGPRQYLLKNPSTEKFPKTLVLIPQNSGWSPILKAETVNDIIDIVVLAIELEKHRVKEVYILPLVLSETGSPQSS